MSFCLIPGVSVPNVDGIKKEYRMKKDGLMFSLSAEDYGGFFAAAVDLISEPMFFFLEIPADNDSFRTYYLECTSPVAKAILKRYGGILYSDGVIRWGFGSHKTDDEIYVQEYQTVSIYSKRPERYAKILDGLKYQKDPSAKLVWDVISKDNPGECINVEYEDETYVEMLNNLIDAGMYPEDSLGE